MKEIFLNRYKEAIREYFNYSGSGEAKRKRLYILDEYERILNEVFGVLKQDTRTIYEKLYFECYGGA